MINKLLILTLIFVFSGLNAQIIFNDYKINGKNITFHLNIDANSLESNLNNFPDSLILGINEIYLNLFINLPNNTQLGSQEFRNSEISIVDKNTIQKMHSILSAQGAVIKGSFAYKGKNYLHVKINPFRFIGGDLYVAKEVKLTFKNNLFENSAINFNEEKGFITSNQNFLENSRYTESFQYGQKTISDYVKISLNKNGIFRVYGNDLVLKGVNINQINPQNIKLLLNGEEIPIFVNGDEDGRFDSEDFIEFYGSKNVNEDYREISSFGEPYKEYFNRYTDSTYYFVIWDDGEGKRVTNDQLTESDSTLTYYNALLRREINNWFDFSMADIVRRELPFWVENKTWNEGNLTVGTRSINFSLNDVYPNKEINLYVKLQDYASNISSNAHALALSLNNLAVQDTVWIDKYEQAVLNSKYNSGLITNGTNTLKLHSYATNAVVNACIIDWYEIEYPRYLKAVNDSLEFSFGYLESTDKYNISISNISSGEVSVWKKGSKFKRLGFNFENNSISFTDSVSNLDSYVIMKNESILKPNISYFNSFNNLTSTNNSAEYLLITDKKFLQVAEEYKSFIENSYQINAKVIDVDDIYDNYSNGFFNPEAIRTFLEIANRNWHDPKPKYVFLVGGATYDYHGNKHKYQGYPQKKNYVPSFGASVSDNWFVIWDSTGANIPQMNIGRVPVETVEEFQFYFEKHKQYIEKSYDDWNKTFMFFSSGKGDNQAELDQLRSVNEYVINNFVEPKPIGGNYHHFYKTANPVSNFGPYSTEYFNNAIDNGAVFISYLGHSGTRIWDNSITEPFQLMNSRNRSPLITDFGCSTGRFAEPDVVSFSELFTLSNDGQAIAYIGNSSLGFLSTAVTVPKLFYEFILKDSVNNISEALNRAKIRLIQEYGSSSVNQLFVLTNTLIGDPIVSLPIPQKPNLSIKENQISFGESQITDQLDSLNITIAFNNYGTVDDDSLNIRVNLTYNENENQYDFRKPLPFFEDKVNLTIPIKNSPGTYNLSVLLDSENEIIELNEDDNLITISFVVSSTSVRPLLSYSVENGVENKIQILNPINKGNSDDIVIQVSESSTFDNFEEYTINFDTIVTNYNLAPEFVNQNRYWIRTKTEDVSDFGSLLSFKKSASKFGLNDSISFNENSFRNKSKFSEMLTISNDSIYFQIRSAGFNDGRYGIIEKNGVNYNPTPELRGHHIVLFERASTNFIKYQRFDTFGGGSATINNYINFLDTLSSNYLIAIAVSDEGRITNTTLKQKIKELGSIYIDSLLFRGSWAILGYKGAAPGSVPEGFTKPTFGSVAIDTTIITPGKFGSLTTTQIGPTTKWERLVVSDSTYSNASINYIPIAITETDSADTLSSLTLNNGVADLSFINAEQYPYLKIKAELNAADDGTSPELYSLGVDYTDVSELAINYQVVSIEHDSITQGENNRLNFMVYNVGESSAQNFKVKVELQKADNSKRILFDQKIALIDSMDRKQFSVDYIPKIEDGTGELAFNISIDPENNVREFFEDNNFYRIPFKVVKDTSVSVNAAKVIVKFDGNQIFDGDYVSPTPEIDIELDYNLGYNYSDTSEVNLFLNNIRIHNGEMSLKEFDTINRKIIYSYKPVLESGNYNLAVRGRNLIGNLEETDGYTANFIVSDEFRLMDVYTYPNPTNNDTYFTFMLTKVPDELEIKVYTIAGRLIKKLNLTAADLKLNFNKIYWDCKDEDGDPVANGTYLYKVTLKDSEETISETQKMAIVR
ncbi:MAG: T9SS type A sorting domain-containing protein [Melioribacteraceae bacterium]|nr:T9SS type A sorting domain-containing protein [Melioribacteraceae bacterium]